MAKPAGTVKDRATNGWDVLRDVMVKSLGTGQFPIALFGAVLILVIWRLPTADLSDVVKRLTDAALSLQLVGHLLWILTLGGWFVHARWQRRNFDKELKRVTGERNKAQEKLLGRNLESSDS